MAIHTDDFEVGKPGRLEVNLLGIGESDAKLVFLEPGRDVGVGFGIDIRINAKRNACSFTHATGDFIDSVEFLLGFDIETEYIGLERGFNLVGQLTDSGKDDACRFAASLQHSLQFAAGNNIETRAEARQQV